MQRNKSPSKSRNTAGNLKMWQKIKSLGNGRPKRRSVIIPSYEKIFYKENDSQLLSVFKQCRKEITVLNFENVERDQII